MTESKRMINTGAMLRAGGIGLAVAFLGFACNAATTLVGQGALASGSSDAAGMAALLGTVGTCVCCLVVLGYGAVGALYAYFAQRSGSALEPGPMALGGGLTAGAVAILASLCNGAFGAATGNFSSQLSQLGALSQQTSALAVGAGAVIGFVLALCIFIVVYIGLGAAGGAIYALVAGNRAKPAPASM